VPHRFRENFVQTTKPGFLPHRWVSTMLTATTSYAQHLLQCVQHLLHCAQHLLHCCAAFAALCAAFAALCAAFAALFAAFAALCAAFTALLCTQCVMNLETHVWPQGVEVCNEELEMPGSEVAAFPWLPQGLLLHYLPDLFLVLLFDCLIYCIEGRRFAISRLNWSSVLLHWRQKCSYLIVCFTALKAEGLQSHVLFDRLFYCIEGRSVLIWLSVLLHWRQKVCNLTSSPKRSQLTNDLLLITSFSQWRSFTIPGTKVPPFPYLMWGVVFSACVVFSLVFSFFFSNRCFKFIPTR